MTMKIEYKNCWESHEYSFSNKRIVELHKVIARSGDEIFEVFSYEDTRHYNDMGQSCTASSKQFFIKVDVLGVKINVTLDSLIKQGVSFFPVGVVYGE